MANPNDPKQPKPAMPLQPNYGATRSDAGAKALAAKVPASDAAARYGATMADSGAATPAGGLPGSGAIPFRIVALIGEGGMGQVHLAHDASLDRLVAVKRIGREHVANERLRQRFFIEARASSRLTHYHIVQVYRLDEDQDGPFIAMEYVAGPLPSRRTDWPADLPNPPLDLEGQVERQGPLKVADAIRLGRQLLSAVEYAHRNNIIHRDIKPANILLTEQWEPKLADFGLARQVNVVDEGRTMAGAQLLTLGYGAPEQEIDASRADHRADLYAVAATLWFALTGQNPRFFRESEVPLELRAILVRGLAKDREKRFQSAAEFAQALEKPTAQPPPVVVLAEAPVAPPRGGPGICPKCGHAHAATAQALANLKFCEQCRSVLQEPCPKCMHVNGIWVRFCGSCGFDVGGHFQRQLDAKNAELNAAAALVKQHEYRKALKTLDELSALPQPRLAALAAAAKRMLPQVEAGYDAAKKQRDEKLALAHGHMVVCQPAQAAQVLAQVPAPLHNKEFTRALRSIEAQAEKKGRLAQEIASGVQAKQYAGLLPKVERMIAMDPNADYYAKLLTFLQEFERQAEKEQLKQSIASHVQAKDYAGLLPKVERMIVLEPRAEYYSKMLPFLQGFERQAAKDSQTRAAEELECSKRSHLVNLGFISLGLNLVGFLFPASLAALGIGVYGGIKAHLRLTGIGEAGPLNELDHAAAEKARLLNVLGAGLSLCWLVGSCAVFMVMLRK